MWKDSSDPCLLSTLYSGVTDICACCALSRCGYDGILRNRAAALDMVALRPIPPATIPPTLSFVLLPDDCLRSILVHVSTVADRNAFSLVSRRFRAVEAHEREELFVGNGLHPVTSALHKLCNCFSSLQRIHIDYSEWTSEMGPQMSDSGLQALSNACRCLNSLTLRFCCFLIDAGISQLSAAPNLRFLTLIFVAGVTGRGLLLIVSSCQLLGLHIEA